MAVKDVEIVGLGDKKNAGTHAQTAATSKAPPKKITYALAVLLMLLWIALFLFTSPQEVLSKIPTLALYILLFVLASVSTGSLLTRIIVYQALVYFIAGGGEVLELSLIAALGMTLSNLLIYMGYKSHKAHLKRTLPHDLMLFKERNTFGLLFIFTAFIPISNKILMGVMAATRYPTRKLAMPLFFGHLLRVFLITGILSLIL